VSGAAGLSARDRADFERVLHLAPATPDIRSGETASAADDEYRTHRVARDRTPGQLPATDGTSGPLRMVPTPLISAVAGAALLLIGYGQRLADAATPFACSVVSAGWILAATAGGTAVFGLCRLLRAARRGGDAAPRVPAPSPPLTYSRRGGRWQQAVLERGVLPCLRRRLPEALAP